MLVFLSVSIWILSLAVMQIRIGFNMYLNVFGNDGFIKVYVFGIRIFRASIHFEHEMSRKNNLIIEHGKKSDKIHLNTDPQDKKSITALLQHPAFSEMNIEKLSAHFIAGKTNDAFFTVVLLQTLRVIFYGTLAPMKCKYGMHITESFTPVYKEDVMQLDVIGIMTISIANIISGIFSHSKHITQKKQEAFNA